MFYHTEMHGYKQISAPAILLYKMSVYIYSKSFKINLLYISQGIDFLMHVSVSKDVNVVMCTYTSSVEIVS